MNVFESVMSNNAPYAHRNFTDAQLEEIVIPELKEQEASTVNLRHNQITAVGLRALAQLPHLTSLDISHNSIGDEGAKILAQNPYLKDLRMDYCQITRKESIEAFLSNDVIEDLWFSGNIRGHCGQISQAIGRKLLENKAKRDPAYVEELQQLDRKRKREELEDSIREAISADNILSLSRLIPDLRQGVNMRLDYGGTLLQYAVNKNALQSAEFLLKIGARIEDHDRKYTSLFNAAERGNVEMTELLLDHGANISGEFHFNKETALTIAAAKFCEVFLPFIEENYEEDNPQNPNLNGLMQKWKEIRARSQFLTPNLIFMDPKYSLDYGEECLKAYKSFQQFFEEETELFCVRFQGADDFKNIIVPLARLYEILFKKYQVIHEKPPSKDGSDDTFSELGDDVDLVYQLEPLVPVSEHSSTLSNSEIKEYVKALNNELKTKTEEEIDWSKYPKFFIAQYRGVHYYRHYFTKAQRADHRRVVHVHRLGPAPAVLKMQGFFPVHHQIARESTLKTHKQTIVTTFEKFKSSSSVKGYWDSRAREFAHQGAMFQQRMSNSYTGYKQDILKKTKLATTELRQKNITEYPHYATSDLPFHALKYAFGQKKIEGLTEWRLRPVFQASGKPLHSYPGKIFVSLFTPLQHYKHQTIHPAGMHNRNLISLLGTVAPERETSIPGGVEPETFFREELMVIPSFEQYRQTYAKTYGVSQQIFDQVKRKISQSWAECDAKKRDRLRKTAKNQAINALIQYKTRELLKAAHQEARRQGGYLIYKHAEKQYGLEPEPMRIPSKGNDFYPKEELALLKEMRKQLAKVNREIPAESFSIASPSKKRGRALVKELPEIPYIGNRAFFPLELALHSSGSIREGLQKLGGRYFIRSIKGDRHSLFRAVAFGIALACENSTQKTFLLEKLQLLNQSMPDLNSDLEKMRVILMNQTSAVSTLTQQSTSDQLVKTLRLLVCKHHLQDDDFWDWIQRHHSAPTLYLKEMEDMHFAATGGEPELVALSCILDIQLNVIDAAAQSHDKLYKEIYYPSDSLSQHIDIHLLLRNDHYDYLIPLDEPILPYPLPDLAPVLPSPSKKLKKQ